jgi:hypothetical protein
VLNSLGELFSRCAANKKACDFYTQGLTIAREVGAPLEEARALEGIGRCYVHDGDVGVGVATCGRHSASTSASEHPTPSASSSSCSAIKSGQPDPKLAVILRTPTSSDGSRRNPRIGQRSV